MAKTPRKSLPLERTFVALVAVLGALLLMFAFNMIQLSHYNIFHQYAMAKRAFSLRSVGVLSQDRIDAITRLFTKPTTAPVTDPPWMMNAHPPQPVRSFKPVKPHPFLKDNVIASPDVCRNVSVDLLIIIHSAVNNFQQRRILRETWAGLSTIQGLTVRRVFALGRHRSGNLTQILVNTEQANFGDIVQGDFQDTVLNLTCKAVNVLRWVNDHCLHARFVLKADDDVFVNVFNLVEYHLQWIAGQRHTVMCSPKPENSSLIVRDPHSPWNVPSPLLAGRTHWPAYCSGMVVIMTTDNIPELYRASFEVPRVAVDEGYVYGLLPLVVAPDRAPRYIDISADLVLTDGKLLTLYKDSSSPSLAPYLAGRARSEVTFLKLWQVTVGGLSPWGKLRASLSHLRVNVSGIPF